MSDSNAKQMTVIQFKPNYLYEVVFDLSEVPEDIRGNPTDVLEWLISYDGDIWETPAAFFGFYEAEFVENKDTMLKHTELER